MAVTGLTSSPRARPTCPRAGDKPRDPATEQASAHHGRGLCRPLLAKSPGPALVPRPASQWAPPQHQAPSPASLAGGSRDRWPRGVPSPLCPALTAPHLLLSDKYNDFIEANRIEDASERMRTLRKLVGSWGRGWGLSPGTPPRVLVWVGKVGGEQRGDPAPPHRSGTCQVTTMRRSSSWWVT